MVHDDRGEFRAVGRKRQRCVEPPHLLAVVAGDAQDGHVGERVDEERLRLGILGKDRMGGN
ncbi:hypothetical protein [Streptomyces sp. NPDC058632]|uniref:hypothetical protein n=1 Tax=unclassified Streptomyces TaxID=2593676 RepID=UPI003652DB59